MENKVILLCTEIVVQLFLLLKFFASMHGNFPGQ